MAFKTTLILTLTVLTLAACGEKEPSVEEALTKASDAVGELSDSIFNLSEQKIKDLAEVSAQLESAPAKGQALLEEHGWTREEFDRLVDQVRGNESARRIFETAKRAASSR